MAHPTLVRPLLKPMKNKKQIKSPRKIKVTRQSDKMKRKKTTKNLHTPAYLRMSRSMPTRQRAFMEDEEERRWANRPLLTCEQHVKCAASLANTHNHTQSNIIAHRDTDRCIIQTDAACRHRQVDG